MTALRQLGRQEKQLRKKIDLASLTRAQARVEIAKDVIAAVSLKRLQPRRGAYVQLTTNDKAPSVEGVEGELRELILKATHCQVCAIGALVVAVAARDNDFKLGWVQFKGAFSVRRGTVFDRLKSFFSPGELDVIEGRFERDEDVLGPIEYIIPKRSLKSSATKALLSLMTKIVRTKGAYIDNYSGR